MTTIRLDAATLDKLGTAAGTVYLCDEAGTPRFTAVVRPANDLDTEPQYTLEQWRQLVDHGPKVSTEELIARIRKGRGA